MSQPLLASESTGLPELNPSEEMKVAVYKNYKWKNINPKWRIFKI